MVGGACPSCEGTVLLWQAPHTETTEKRYPVATSNYDNTYPVDRWTARKDVFCIALSLFAFIQHSMSVGLSRTTPLLLPVEKNTRIIVLITRQFCRRLPHQENMASRFSRLYSWYCLSKPPTTTAGRYSSDCELTLQTPAQHARLCLCCAFSPNSDRLYCCWGTRSSSLCCVNSNSEWLLRRCGQGGCSKYVYRQAAEASESRQTQESVSSIAETSMIELRQARTEDRRREYLDCWVGEIVPMQGLLWDNPEENIWLFEWY